jgi:peroxiredoxin
MEVNLKNDSLAPDFAAHDLNDEMIKLSQFQKKKNVFLVLSRGFL